MFAAQRREECGLERDIVGSLSKAKRAGSGGPGGPGACTWLKQLDWWSKTVKHNFFLILPLEGGRLTYNTKTMDYPNISPWASFCRPWFLRVHLHPRVH